MGEYATYQLQDDYRIFGAPKPPRVSRTRTKIKCPLCIKVCRGKGGLMSHERSKHGIKHKGMDIDYQIQKDKEMEES